MTTSEQKTKPTQTTVKELRATGLSPDFLICRTASPLEKVCLLSGCHV